MLAKTFKRFIVPAIGQGTGGNDVCDDRQRIRVLECGIELGMTLIDTAEAYRNGQSEEIVGKAIAGKRDKVFICTKFSPEHNHFAGVATALEGSLRRLGTDYVDLFQVHWPNPAVPMEETLGALDALKEGGKVLHIGVSNFSLRDLVNAQLVGDDAIESVQLEYNLLERGAEEGLLPYCEGNDIMTLAYTPLRRGQKGSRTLAFIADKYQKTAGQVILNWLVSRKSVVPIPKTLSLEHTRENALATDFCLAPEDISEIDRVFNRVAVEVPTDQIRVLPSDSELVYTTLEDALANRFDLVPSPRQLASDILENGVLKPVCLRPTSDSTGKYLYDLTQGRVRYWAWVIAYGDDVPIPAFMYE